VSESGEVVAKYDYTPFGKLINTFGSTQSGISNAFLFSSEYHDEETGLVYYNYRYYNPELGRWMSCDPIGERGGLNLYGMVGNNPVGNWDYLGLVTLFGMSNSSTDVSYAMAQNINLPVTTQVKTSFDWSSVLEEFLLNHVALSASKGAGVTIPVGAGGFINIGVSGSLKVFNCYDSTKRKRAMFQFSIGIEVQGGVGAGLGIKKYPTVASKDGNKVDKKTGKKLKHLAGENLPWYKQTGSSKGGGFAFDKGCSCPKEGWTGSIKLGVGGEIGAGLVASGKAFAQWEFGKPFNWSNIHGKVEANLEFRNEAVAKIFIFGGADGTWSKYIK
jgi:RHS repeat-associated protein